MNTDQHSPSVFDVFVDDNGHYHGDKGEVDGGHEHNHDAEHQTDQRQTPVVELETGPPIRRPQECLDGTGQVDKAVAHEEEHGEQRRQQINVAQQDSALADAKSQDQGPRWLATLRGDGKRREEWYNTILSDGLQQSWCSRQTLEAGAERGEQGSDQNHVLVGPGNVRHHQFTAYRLTESVKVMRLAGGTNERQLIQTKCHSWQCQRNERIWS